MEGTGRECDVSTGVVGPSHDRDSGSTFGGSYIGLNPPALPSLGTKRFAAST